MVPRILEPVVGRSRRRDYANDQVASLRLNLIPDLSALVTVHPGTHGVTLNLRFDITIVIYLFPCCSIYFVDYLALS